MAGSVIDMNLKQAYWGYKIGKIRILELDEWEQKYKKKMDRLYVRIFDDMDGGRYLHFLKRQGINING